jgi:hypothetical protein
MKVDETIRMFGISGTDFSSAVLKTRRDKDMLSPSSFQEFHVHGARNTNEVTRRHIF